MSEKAFNPLEQWLNLRKICVGGFNALDLAQDISDNECPDLINVDFDEGVLSPRKGSALFLNRPTGETQHGLQLMFPFASDGIQYYIAIYGNHIYLRDFTTNQWIRINQTLIPTLTDKKFGWTVWNDGIGDDHLYFGNGTDPTYEWFMALDHLAVATTVIDTTLTLTDGTRFSGMFRGKVIVQDPSGVTLATLPFASITGNVITLQAPVGVVFPIGSSVTVDVFQPFEFMDVVYNTLVGAFVVGETITGGTSGTTAIIVSDTGTSLVVRHVTGATLFTVGETITGGTSAATALVVSNNPHYLPLGSVLGVWDNRLFLTASHDSPLLLNWSLKNDFEDFDTTTGVDGAGFENILDIPGPNISIKNFGQFLLIGKRNGWVSFVFNLNDTLNVYTVSTRAIISGDSSGPITPNTVIQSGNLMYYPSATEGIFGVQPTATGTQTTTDLELLSKKINPFVIDADFTGDSSTLFENKLIWKIKVPDPLITINTTLNKQYNLLIYDLIYQAWTKYDNWIVNDMGVFEDGFYFLNNLDYNIYQGFQDYQDGTTQGISAYESFFLTKQFDFGVSSSPKIEDFIFIQGSFSRDTTFFIDVMFNENGSLGKQTYKINKSTIGPTGVTIFDAIGVPKLGTVPLGWINIGNLANSVIKFRVYLSVSNFFGFYNLQLKVYSNAIGSKWAVDGIGFSPVTMPAHDPLMEINPGGIPLVIQ